MVESTLSASHTEPPMKTEKDKMVVAAVALGLGLLYLPAYWELAHTVWQTDEQGHGPIIFGVSLWLLYRQRHLLEALTPKPSIVVGSSLLLFGLVSYALGRSQSFLMLEVISQLPVLAALLLLFVGAQAFRIAWFPLFFLFFMTPFPEALVATVTGPLKSAVSVVAANALYGLGYPVSRVGVILNVGQYQLLVADACAGLNSMFTLEALGLLYLNLMKYTTVARNVALCVLIVPIAFVANMIRVMILVLVTYHFGDAAGQGFIHSFAGMVLFLVGLTLVMAIDFLLGFFYKNEKNVGAGV
jgi:exosortase B